MPPTVEDRLLDVKEAILEIEDILKDISLDQFKSQPRTLRLIERHLEIVCEAARNIPDYIKQDAPGIDWQKMTDFGNVLRRAYHSTRPDGVSTIIQEHLPALKSFVEQRIREGGP
jgi:uncharacterized protein with HEPN domain